MRKFMLTLILLISATVILAACGNSNKESKENENSTEKSSHSSADLLAKVQEKGEIIIGTEGTYPPFTFHNDSGKLTGFDVDIATEVTKRLDLKPVFLETQWDAMFAGLDSKRFDMIANQVGMDKERLAKYDFSDHYNVSVGVIVANSGNNNIKSYEDIKGLKSAQTMTSNHRSIAESFGAEIVGVEGFVQSVELINSGRVDVTVNDKLSVLDFLKKKPDANVKIVATGNDVLEIGLMFRQGNGALVEAVNQALRDMIEDGTHLEISKKWFGEDVLK